MIWFEKIIGAQNAKGYFKKYSGGALADQGGNPNLRSVEGGEQ